MFALSGPVFALPTMMDEQVMFDPQAIGLLTFSAYWARRYSFIVKVLVRSHNVESVKHPLIELDV